MITFISKRPSAAPAGDTTLTPTLRWTVDNAGSLTLSGSDVDEITSVGSASATLTKVSGNNEATLVGTAGTTTAYLDSPALSRSRLVETGLTQSGGCDCTVFAIVKMTGSALAPWFKFEDTTSGEYFQFQMLSNGRAWIDYHDGTTLTNTFDNQADANFHLLTWDISTTVADLYLGTNTSSDKNFSITGATFDIDRIEVLQGGSIAFARIDFFDGQMATGDRETHASELNTRYSSLIGT